MLTIGSSCPMPSTADKAPCTMLPDTPPTTVYQLNGHFCVSQLLLDLTRLVERYLSPDEVEKVECAFMFAAHAHRMDKRKSGEPYIIHPMHVTCILADMHVDVDTLCAALLHDVVEDTNNTLEDVEKSFGKTVATLVDGVTKLHSKEYINKEQATKASFKKMMEFMVNDFRVVLIKLADRLHNVSTLGSMSPEKRRRIANETLEIHVPLARSMGINKLRHQLQEHAFQNLAHRRWQVIEDWWQNYLDNNKELREDILERISTSLNQARIGATVFEWDKNLYKIYVLEKTRRGRKNFNRKEFPFEIRVIVNHDQDCYAALGILHQHFRPKNGAFKDHIAVPKSYGFQSLQTTLLTPTQTVVKLTIQSREMYQVAQYGITSQWRYPHLNRKTNIKVAQQHLNSWLSDVSDIQQATDDPDIFMSDMKAVFSYNEITTYTPCSDVKIFPSGATVVDFAYAIHTQTGHTCIDCQIDGDPAPLSTPLKDGNTVEIITSATATPHPSWLTFVKTGKARSAIRHWLDHQNDDKIISLGETLLRGALASHGQTLGEVDPRHMQRVLSDIHMHDTRSLFHAIGKGNHCSKLAARRLLNNAGLQQDTHKDEQPLLIKSTQGLAVHFQTCCNPIPKDTIIAKLNPEYGLEVHRSECPHIRNQHSIETVTLAWEDSLAHEFNACLLVRARNTVGVLRTITSRFESLGINIEDLNITGDVDVKENHLLIKVKSTTHLQQIIDSLKKERSILYVQRLFNIEVNK